jgi:hypothetical protein
MDARDVHEGRRAFLARLVGTGAVSIAGCAAGLRPAAAALGLEASGDPYAAEVLEEPIVLRSGEFLVDRSFVLSKEFRDTTSSAIIVVTGNGVTVRNVRTREPTAGPSLGRPEPGRSPLPGVFARRWASASRTSAMSREQVSIEGRRRWHHRFWDREGPSATSRSDTASAIN